eukprot:m.181005 g.181005  ORF g.181005 m.181005 type:complete len:350 (+) comp15509_c0_seq16:156-1205(+)
MSISFNSLHLDTFGPKGPPQDLLVLVHGFNGRPSDYQNLLTTLKESPKWTRPGIILRTTGIPSLIFNSTSGILPYAVKAVSQIECLLGARCGGNDKSDLVYPSIDSFSICGHSLGGIVARVVIKLLFDKGILCRENSGSKNQGNRALKPLIAKMFMTIASPHLGCRRPKRFTFNTVYMFLVPYVALTTGRELLLDDNEKQPLLLSMSQDVYLEALGLFKERILFANVFYDLTVPYCTGVIAGHQNPYRNGNVQKLVFLQDASPYIIDTKNTKYLVEPEKVPLEFSDDDKQAILRDMVKNLNSVTWRKYEVLMPPSLGFPAHLQIMNFISYFGGKPMKDFIAKQMIECIN